MRSILIWATMVLTAGCGGRESTLSGTLAEGEDVTHVWVVGGTERTAVVNDSFHISRITGDPVEILFARGEREAGRMELRDIPRGTQLSLRGIAVDDMLAFPASIVGDDDVIVSVNGVRLGTPGSIPGSVDGWTTLLSRSRSGDALLVRPDGDRLPDLRVVTTPGTEIRTEDGDPTSLERTDFGDSIRIVGKREAGFVIATLVEIRRSRADRSDASTEGGSTSRPSAVREAARVGTTSPAIAAPVPRPTSVSEKARKKRDREQRDRERRDRRGPPAERGRQRGG
ncbi:MAG: hypothetical protein H0U67_15620 [Gemmatimonadetes bacterium]|nr:hypothetical protein [Gemmatimonadota bacterium]